MQVCFIAALASLASQAVAKYTINVRTGALPYFLLLQNGNRTVVINDGVLAGDANSSTTAVSVDAYGQITNNGTSGFIGSTMITPSIARVEVNTTSLFTGAKFAIANGEKLFGIWEYPWNGEIMNKNVTFDLKGVGDSEGINWSNARAPFFISSFGYGIYADTLAMGSFNLSGPNHAQFIFNTSNLVYYCILPQGTPYNFKSILAQYMNVSSKIEMPPDSAYGPTFWSDDFEQDFHDGVTNAEEKYYDVVNHLYANKIHATAILADRHYGAENQSFGNFEFDSRLYPDPSRFITNLSEWGYAFQARVANRASAQTDMFATGSANNWLFPSNDTVGLNGSAFDLTIPEAYSG